MDDFRGRLGQLRAADVRMLLAEARALRDLSWHKEKNHTKT